MLITLVVPFLLQANAQDLPTCPNIKNVEKTVTETIDASKKEVSDSAKTRFIREICSLMSIHQPLPFPTAEESVREWLTFSSSTRITEQNAKYILYNWRTHFVGQAIKNAIEARYRENVEDKGLYQAVLNDTTAYSKRMANSDSTVAEVLAFSSNYSKAAFGSASTGEAYNAYKESLEKVIVNIRFSSKPPNAQVVLKSGNAVLGSTEFGKPMDSGREYIFLIKKDGFETLEEKRYFPPTPKDQTVDFILKAQK
jgi:hypothetical protein